MGESTKIQWCDHTFNPWRGCTKVAPGCANCYAEKGAKRNPSVLGIWGPNGTRVVAAEKAWAEPLKWNKAAAEAGVRRRVFCASLADVFEDWQGPIRHSDGSELWRCKDQEPNRWVRWPANGVTDFLPHELANYNAGMFRRLSMDDVRARLFALIDATPNLDWLLVTKRPENVRRMWPNRTLTNNPEMGKIETRSRPNVWLLTSVSDQATYDSAAPHLWSCRDLVPVLGFSAEPLLGPIKIHHDYDGQLVRNWAGCWDWWIAGGESGHGARPCDLGWIRSIVAQCREGGVACFVKQLGSKPVFYEEPGSLAEWPRHVLFDIDSEHDDDMHAGHTIPRLRDPKGGDPSEWREDLRVREWPNTKGGE